MLAPKRAVVVVVFFFFQFVRLVHLLLVYLVYGLRTLADGVFCKFTGKQKSYRCLDLIYILHLGPRPVAQLFEHRVIEREVVSSTSAGPTLRVLK